MPALLRPAIAACCAATALTAVPATAAPPKVDLLTTAHGPGALTTYYRNIAISGSGRYAAYVTSEKDTGPAEISPPAEPALYYTDLVTLKSVRVMKGNCCQHSLSLSRDGRYLVFESGMPDLVPKDRNARRDVFLYDAKTRRLIRMLNIRGGELELGAVSGVVTPDGTKVIYQSSSDVYVKRNQQAPPCTIYEYTIRTGKTRHFEVGGKTLCAFSGHFTASSDGRYLALSTMDGMVRGDDFGSFDVYWVDTREKRVVRVSEPGVEGSETETEWPSIDGSGRLIAWIGTSDTPYSLRANSKVFLRDVKTGQMIDVNYGMFGSGANSVEEARLSENGRWLTFTDNRGNAPGTNHYDLRAVYVRDLTKDISTTFRLEPLGDCPSVAATCAHPSSQSAVPSGDGKVIAYITNARRVEQDRDDQYDVYSVRF